MLYPFKHSASYFKKEIGTNIDKLKNNQSWAGIVISDVLSQQEIEQRRDLGCIVAFAKPQVINAKKKRDKLISDEKVYKHEDLDELLAQPLIGKGPDNTSQQRMGFLKPPCMSK